ncbi:peptidoglycan bridge formation glycyltransferase FemA/FemB family protein [uncultured Prochlorococcus sp.]|uniref:peptidoglycan bridge formation glycyltransferase FemA/FemB family protein n=1 Tax=uncultured Prochlorococcus sp. TaxID=159733 RepID=UPI002582B943|nr:peptidoglycan bridge formation glycyltransferase FemA/FemB family protein [uncultured Prochlorococcus sp.]
MRIEKIFTKLNYSFCKNPIKKLKGKKNKFIVDEIDLSEYKKIYEKLNFTNISHIQTPGYYLNKDYSYYLKIYHKNHIYGIVSLTKKSFCLGLIKFFRINDGPLICKEFHKYKYLVLIEIIRFIKNKYTKLISFSPSYIYTYDKHLKKLNFIKLRSYPTKTYIVDLLKSEQELFKKLRGNWRNGLKKGLKFAKAKEINDINMIKNILIEYNKYAMNLSFIPISHEKCLNWLFNDSENNGLLSLKIYQASSLKEPDKNLGSIGVLLFKDKALYLFGFTNDMGRKFQANTLLLWHAIIESKKKGLKEFDLGGFNKKTSNGIKKFKEGLNGRIIETLGEYIYISFF